MIVLKYVFAALISLIVAYLIGLSYSTRQHRIKPENERQLADCPNKPNCVYSQSTQNSHRVKAFPLMKEGKLHSWDYLVSAVEQAGGKILINDGRYMHAVFSSAVFQFKDDFEASINKNQIDIRSASRAGASDLGKNRKRVDAIRQLYTGKDGA
jgi:uncharacterized protein (DUF1499 family)